MMKRKFTLLVAAAAAFTANSFASIFFSLDVGSLKDGNGDPLVGSGMLYLIVSTGDSDFSLPADGEVIPAGSDDEIVASWDLSNAPDDDMILVSGAVAFGSNWSEGDPLGIVWIPGLAPGNNPAAGQPFGFYRNTSSDPDGDPWTMPADKTMLTSLKFFTSDSGLLASGGGVPAVVGAASFDVGDPNPAGPTAPTTPAASENSPRTVNVSWLDGSSPGGGFRIERRESGGSDWSVIGFVDDPASQINDTTAGRGKEYEYRVLAINGFDEEVSSVSAIETLRSNIVNLSTRGPIGSGDEVMIMGFVVTGTGNAELLSRSVGPGIQQFGINNFSPDPESRLVDAGQVDLDTNDDWEDTQKTEIEALETQVGAFELDDGSTDAALIANVPAGTSYTIITNDPAADGGADPGVAISEVYDAFSGLPNDATYRLVNLSTRGLVESGDGSLIGGLVINGQVGTKVLIRAAGPSLGALGVPGTISDPVIIVKDVNQVEIDRNDDWQDDDAALLEQTFLDVGAFSFSDGSKDAAIILDLDNGNYTAIVEGVGGATGIALLEIYEIPDE